jgi:hypothetical protein
MIINPYEEPMDIVFQWRHIPAFENSTSISFGFADISKSEVWRSGSSVGFVYSGVPPHGSLVMVVWEAESEVEGIATPDWVNGNYVD